MRALGIQRQWHSGFYGRTQGPEPSAGPYKGKDTEGQKEDKKHTQAT